MGRIDDLYRQLLALRRSPGRAAAYRLEQAILDSEEEGPAWGILSELAGDLAYYVPEEEWRREHTTYFGDDKLRDLLDDAIVQLDRLGIGK